MTGCAWIIESEKEKNFLLLDPNNCNLIFIADSFKKMQSIFKNVFTADLLCKNQECF